MAIYGLNTWFGKPMVGGAFLDGHLHDMLAPFVLLSWAGMLATGNRAARRWLHSPIGALAITGGAALFWEVLTPILLERSVADVFDVISYFSGTLIFLVVHHVILASRPLGTSLLVPAGPERQTTY